MNKMDHGGKKPGGGGVGKSTNKVPANKGGHLGGKASGAGPKAARVASAKKAARTREQRR